MEHRECTVATWFDLRGFGFIRLPDGREVFVHAKIVHQAGLDKLRIGERVDIDLETAPDGRMRVARLTLSHLRVSAAAKASAALAPVRM
jgi:cold shock CspA family protein